VKLVEMAGRPARWLVQSAAERDIVLSSRVRLARNVEGHSFPHLLSEDALRGLRSRILEAVQACPQLEGAGVWGLEELEELERRFLLERHLVSLELVENPMGRAVAVAADEAAGVMVNEEDHLRLQAFGPGLCCEATLERALGLAQEVEEKIPYSRSPRLGYLTACPTNVGTGLRASILVHLPGLILTKDVERVLNSLRVLNYTVRGFYGEGSGVMGALFQISNSATLGLGEAEIVDDLLHHVRKVISVEREARAVLLRRERARMEDRVWRAWGLLHSARLLSTREAFDLLGDVRLGTSLRLLPGLDESVLSALLMGIQGAHRQVVAGRPLSAAERDEERAAFVRRRLEESLGESKPGIGKDEE
jgi:protein arginine kinase